MTVVKIFREISKEDVAEVGGKGASLGEMIRAGMPVPPGFVITTEAFDDKLLPIESKMSQKGSEQILEAFDNLDAERVAVRSSAVAEDSLQASWAGQLETYLNVSRENLIEKIRECWNSIKSERALAYAAQQDLSKDQLVVAVVIQKMVDSQSSGVIFTVNPITKKVDEIMVEAGYGLGELLVQGLITPDNFIVNKKTLEIKNRDIQSQDTMLVFQDGENKEVPVPADIKDKQAISDVKVKELAELAIKIEEHHGKPQDIEWAVDNEGEIWILQSRPITTF